MRRNLSELEQRLILLLKRNSRMSIVDIASELGTSRLTAKKAMDSIISSGRIKKFTISIADEEKDMVLVYTDNLDNIPRNIILERFSLIDGSYMVILYYEDLIKIKKANIKRVEIATSRESYLYKITGRSRGFSSFQPPLNTIFRMQWKCSPLPLSCAVT
jgi:DNA-binding Lrp family transcriptional regulator